MTASEAHKLEIILQSCGCWKIWVSPSNQKVCDVCYLDIKDFGIYNYHLAHGVVQTHLLLE